MLDGPTYSKYVKIMTLNLRVQNSFTFCSGDWN